MLKDIHFDTFGANFMVRTIDENMVAYEQQLLEMTHNKAQHEETERKKALKAKEIEAERKSKRSSKGKKKVGKKVKFAMD